jgi:polyhydroxybutyrate depolymerase
MELTTRQKVGAANRSAVAGRGARTLVAVAGPRNRTAWVLGGVIVVLVLVVAVLAVLLARTGDDGPASTTSPDRPTSTQPGSSVPGQIPPTPTSTTSTPAGPVSFQDVTMQEGIIQRQYLVVRPADAPLDEPLPAVLVLHGLGVDRFGMAAVAPWAEAVARDDFVAVFPQGVLNSWNVGPCCPPASLAGVDDIGFLGRVVDQVVARPDVDPDRLYLTGFSNGGIMAYALACARTDDFAAVAPMAAVNLTGCTPSRPISLLHQHGDPDPTVPYDGSASLSQLLSSKPFPPVPSSVAAWAEADGCDAQPDRTDERDGVTVDEWPGCPKGITVELITYPGNGHNWPTEPLDGLDELLRFFDLQR